VILNVELVVEHLITARPVIMATFLKIIFVSFAGLVMLVVVKIIVAQIVKKILIWRKRIMSVYPVVFIVIRKEEDYLKSVYHILAM